MANKNQMKVLLLKMKMMKMMKMKIKMKKVRKELVHSMKNWKTARAEG